VRTISHKTPNPFTAPVNIPKTPTDGLAAPTDPTESHRMYSSSPFSTSPANSSTATSSNPPPHQHQHQPSQPQQSQLHNVVTGQYNAPPTPPSTARSGSIDDKLDLSASSSNPSYSNDGLTHPQPQQGYQHYSDIPSSDAMIGSASGLLTPVQSISDRMPSSTRYTPTQESAANSVRQTKGKYAINDFSIQRTLGTGSFGRVHLVQSRHNHRFYAIKVYRPLSILLTCRSSRKIKSSK
jgi:protein kinase A